MEYTIKQAAEALGSSKSTIRRLVDKLPPEYISAGEYRGHTSLLISKSGFDALKAMLGASELPQELNREAIPSDSSAPTATSREGSAEEYTAPGAAALIAELRDRIAAQERQISALTSALEKSQDALSASHALHAATAEQLRLLTAAAPAPAPEPAQPRSDQEESGQEEAAAPKGPPEDQGTPGDEGEPRRSFWARLKYILAGGT